MDLRTLIYRYCNYQERCQKEVRNKLYDNGANSEDVGQLMAELIDSGLINEERYAQNFARGKFRIKLWGKIKIVYELKQDQISEYCIKKALKEIDETEYWDTLRKLCERKLLELKGEKNEFVLKSKLYRYLIQKGYESTLVQEVINELI